MQQAIAPRACVDVAAAAPACLRVSRPLRFYRVGRRSGVACRARRAGNEGSRTPPKAPKKQGRNYYDLLGVPSSASGEEIKAQYRKLQKAFHPDVISADLSQDEIFADMSIDVNEAFSTLKDESLRAEYDRMLRAENGGRMPDSGALRASSTGLVGPIREGSVLMVEDLVATADEVAAEADQDAAAGARRSLVVWVREWSKTLAFSAGMPLPMSVQADDIPGGARLSFVGVNDGEVQTAGALEFTVVPRTPEDNSQAEEMGAVLSCGLWSAQVRRISFGVELPPPAEVTEERVLKAFAAALRCRAKRAERGGAQPWSSGFGLSGLAAAVTQSFIGGIPFFASDDSEASGLEAYHLKHDLSTVDDGDGSD